MGRRHPPLRLPRQPRPPPRPPPRRGTHPPRHLPPLHPRPRRHPRHRHRPQRTRRPQPDGEEVVRTHHQPDPGQPRLRRGHRLPRRLRPRRPRRADRPGHLPTRPGHRRSPRGRPNPAGDVRLGLLPHRPVDMSTLRTALHRHVRQRTDPPLPLLHLLHPHPLRQTRHLRRTPPTRRRPRQRHPQSAARLLRHRRTRPDRHDRTRPRPTRRHHRRPQCGTHRPRPPDHHHRSGHRPVSHRV